MKIEPNDSVAMRAVRGVLAGYVAGGVFVWSVEERTDQKGSYVGQVVVNVHKKSVAKMLKDEKRKAKR